MIKKFLKKLITEHRILNTFFSLCLCASVVITTFLNADVWFGDYKEGLQGITIIPKGPIVLYNSESEPEFIIKTVFSDGTINLIEDPDNNIINVSTNNNIIRKTHQYYHNQYTDLVYFAIYETNNIPDTDGDRIPDFWEIAHNMYTNDTADAGQDWNSNGFNNLMEFVFGNTEIGVPPAFYPDSDSGNDDNDLDGMPNWWEEKYEKDGLDPNEYNPYADSDNDGLTDYEEYLLGTNPTVIDSDGDGISDFWDINPTDANPVPVIVVIYPEPGSEI